MNKKPGINLLTVLSASLLAVLAIFSIVRFDYLPQFIDGYYHLSCAQGFEKSGGWTGIDWWNFAPAGRPHLYPPLYHFILIFLKTLGFSGLSALRLTETAVVPLFFGIMWYVFQRGVSRVFAFFLVLVTSSFFSFYSSVSGNVPASCALILSFVSLLFLQKKKIISSALFLALAFYAHAGIPWILLISFVVIAVFNREYRKPSLLSASGALALAMPLLVHEMTYLGYVNFSILREVRFCHLSIFIIVAGLAGFFYCRKKDFFTLFFYGYVLGAAIIFSRYPYRLFSAQGILGLAFFAALLLAWWYQRFPRFRHALLLGSLMFFLVFHPTIDFDNGVVSQRWINATYYNIASGSFVSLFEFNSFLYMDRYRPVLETISRHTGSFDIIAANLKTPAQIFSALSNRPTSVSLLGEVRSFGGEPGYPEAKIITWIKPADSDFLYWRDTLKLTYLYEDELAIVLENPRYTSGVRPVPSRIPFKIVSIIGLFFFFIFIADNATIFKSFLYRS